MKTAAQRFVAGKKKAIASKDGLHRQNTYPVSANPQAQTWTSYSRCSLDMRKVDRDDLNRPWIMMAEKRSRMFW